MMRLAALLACALLAGCHNDCSFDTRCNGNVLETCGGGPDQLVNRKIRADPCTEPNPLCVQVVDSRGATHAGCVENDTHCDATSRPACTGADLLECDANVSAPFVVACPDGGACATFADGGARCTGS